MKCFFTIYFLFLIGCGDIEKDSTPLVSFNFKRDIMIWEDNDLPVSLGVDHRFTDEDVDGLSEMIFEWEAATNREFVNEFYFFKHTNLNSLEDYYYKDSQFGVHFADTPIFGVSETVVAVCQVFVEHDYDLNNKRVFKIKHGDIVLNDYFIDYNHGGGEDKFDLRTIFLHEFGHFIGLGHTPDGTMKSYMGPDYVNHSLDIEIENIAFENYNFENSREPTNYVRQDFNSVSVASKFSEKYLIKIFMKKNQDNCSVEQIN